MLAVAKKQTKADEPASKKRRNVIFITLDDEIEASLQGFIDSQRIKPDRAAIGLTALIEFLEREGFPKRKR